MKREDIIRNSYVKSGIVAREGQTIRLSRGKAVVIDNPKPNPKPTEEQRREFSRRFNKLAGF